MESYEKQNEEESCSLFIHQYFFAKKKSLGKRKKKECCSQINEQNVMANHDIIILSAKKLLC